MHACIYGSGREATGRRRGEPAVDLDRERDTIVIEDEVLRAGFTQIPNAVSTKKCRFCTSGKARLIETRTPCGLLLRAVFTI